MSGERRAVTYDGSASQFSVQREPTSGSSNPPSLLKRESAGVDCMQRASFITSSMVWLARCKILVPLQLMGWYSAQACSAIADLSVWHLTPALNGRPTSQRSSTQKSLKGMSERSELIPCMFIKKLSRETTLHVFV